MKRLFISILLLIALICLSVMSNVHIGNKTDSVIDKLEKIRNLSYSDNYDEAYDISLELRTEWNDFCDNRIYVVDIQHIIEITELLARVDSLTEQQNKDVITECDAVLSLLKSYKSKNSLKIKNVL